MREKSAGKRRSQASLLVEGGGARRCQFAPVAPPPTRVTEGVAPRSLPFLRCFSPFCLFREIILLLWSFFCLVRTQFFRDSFVPCGFYSDSLRHAGQTLPYRSSPMFSACHLPLLRWRLGNAFFLRFAPIPLAFFICTNGIFVYGCRRSGGGIAPAFAPRTSFRFRVYIVWHTSPVFVNGGFLYGCGGFKKRGSCPIKIFFWVFGRRYCILHRIVV